MSGKYACCIIDILVAARAAVIVFTRLMIVDVVIVNLATLI